MSSAPVKIAIVGYGNIGRGVRAAIDQSPDMDLSFIHSRSPQRVITEVGPDIPVYPAEDLSVLSQADVAILCGGSKEDLPIQGPLYAERINTVDSYDNHSQIPEYFASIDSAAGRGSNLALISTGWDPGTFSLERVLGNAFIPGAKTYGFYGLTDRGGLSMGHSDALRSIKGVKDARQYTHAVPEAIEAVRQGQNPELKPGDMHWRECFVAVEDGVDTEAIAREIKQMPGYFAPYRTEVKFVSKQELDAKHRGFPHDGLVIGSGITGSDITGSGNRALIEYRNVWDSNPEATANILVAHARAVQRLAREGRSGALTILDIPPAYLSPLSREELLRNYL